MAKDHDNLKDIGKNGKKPSFLDKVVQSVIGEGRHVGNDDDPAVTTYPQLWDMMSRIYLPDNYVRQPASLTLTLTPGGVQVSLYDKETGYTIITTCTNLDDALKAMEAELNKDNPQMRSNNKKEPQYRKRKRPNS